MESSSDHLYHEKQVRELCALHALNNLFQNKDAFSKNELDSICSTLSPENWVNPHKSMFGLGNYDVNVIMGALQSRGYEMVWFDKRKDPSCLNLESITGFILNIPTDYKFSFITIPLRRRHWIALRMLNGLYYNLDSKLDAPKAIGLEGDLLSFIRNELDSQDKELFIVMMSEVERSQAWLKENSNYNNKICDSQNRDAEEILVGDINVDKDGSQRQVKRSDPRTEDPTTIQGRLEMGLSALNLIHEPIVCMASRTDAGVHALNAACHVDLQRQYDMIYAPEIVTLCLNRYFSKEELPIRIINTTIVPDEFHCKRNVISRTYLYRILVAKHAGGSKSTLLHFMPIEEFQRTLFYGNKSDKFCINRMRLAAKMFEGFHDFRTFMGKTSDQNKLTRREISSIGIIERKKEDIGVSPFYTWPKCAAKNNESDGHIIIDMYFKGKGFLYKQVRRTAGTILTASTGQISLRDIRFMLEVPSKHSWLPQIKTLPAHGLYLCHIEY